MSVLVLTAAVFSGLFAADAVEIRRDASQRDSIREAILESYAAELAWYKAPGEQRLTDLEEWFVPIRAGGERLRIIKAAVDRLRRCQRRIGPTAATTSLVFSITLSGAEAEAHVRQSLYQPVEDLRDGEWAQRALAPADLSFSVPDQIYLLRRIEGRWRVQSAPQPQNLGPC